MLDIFATFPSSYSAIGWRIAAAFPANMRTGCWHQLYDWVGWQRWWPRWEFGAIIDIVMLYHYRTYISDYTCTKTEPAYMVRDSSKSFPSGHSSISFFEAIFMIWYVCDARDRRQFRCIIPNGSAMPPNNRYVHRRVPKLRSRLLVPTIQTLLLLWALFVAFSRIVNNRHHWWDVVLGAMLGILFAVLTVSMNARLILTRMTKVFRPLQCVYLCKDFKRKPAQDVSTQNGNIADRHTSVRRLLAEPCCKDEVTMSHVIVTWLRSHRTAAMLRWTHTHVHFTWAPNAVRQFEWTFAWFLIVYSHTNTMEYCSTIISNQSPHSDFTFN